MSDAVKIETVFYELEAKTDLFDQKMEAARASIRRLSGERSAPLKVTADTTGVEKAVDTAKKKVKELPGGDQRPAIITLTGNIEQLEAKLAEAKKLAAEVGATREGKPLAAKLDAQISAFEAKIATARQRVDQLSREASGIKFDANSAQLTSSLKQASTSLTKFADDLTQKLDVSPAVEASKTKIGEFSESFEVAGVKTSDVAEKITEAFASPATAVATVTAAVVTLIGVSTGMAAQFDTEFRKLTAALPTETDTKALGALKEEIVDLTLVSPRTADELNGVAVAISKMGEADPAEIAANLRTVALVGDALAETDLNPLADQLDLIGDAFGLTAEEARQALVQIAAMTKGKIQLDDLNGVLGKSATRMSALGISAQEAAAAMTVLVDAGVNARQITTGLVDLLDKSGSANRASLEAAAAGKDADAKALRVFADTVNETTIASRGLVGAIGDLYRNFQGSREQFAAAGLSLNDFQIAAKAADATTAGAKAQVLSYAESLEKLKPAAEVNRTSAAALSQVLKNELAAQLIDLGNVFLPTVNKGLQLLVDLLSDTRRAARDATDALPDARKFIDQGRTGFAVKRLQPTIAKIQQSPGVLEGYNLDQLRDLQGVFRALQNAGEGSDGLSKALAAVEARIQALSGASATLVTAAKPTADALRNTGETAKEAAQKLESARDAATSLFNSLSDQEPAERARAQIDAWAEAARKAKVPAAEITTTVNRLTEAFRAAADAKSAKAVADAIAELTGDLAALQAEASGSALQTLDVAFAKITAELEKKAKASRDAAEAAEQLGDAESAEKLRTLARGYEEQVKVAEKRRDGLKDLATLSQRVAAAQEVQTRFTKAANAAFGESVPTIADLNRAENDLLNVRTLLQQLANDPKTDPAVRAEAQKLLATLVKEEAKATGEVGQQTQTAAKSAIELGTGIQSSAMAALSLVQILGDGNTELAQMLASVANIGSGISGLGAAAGKAGGFGKLFGSASGIASAIGPIGAIAGGVISMVSVFGKQGEEAKKRAEELRVAGEQFQANLAKFVRDIAEQDVGSFSKQRNTLAEGIGTRLGEAATAAGLDGKQYAGTRQTAESLRGLLQSVLATAAGFGDKGSEAYRSLMRFALGIEELIKTADTQEKALRERQAREIQAGMNDLAVRRLVLQGRDEEAAAMRDQLAAQKELDDALSKFEGGEGYQEYIRALREIQQAEMAAAAATRARTRVVNKLNDDNDILGGTAGDKLTRGLAAFGSLFTDIKDIAKGFDLSSADGLTGLKGKLQELYRTISADGISDAEQPIVDAIKALLGNIDAALEAIADPFAESVEAFGEMVQTLGLSYVEQLKGFATIYKDKFPDFAALLGDGFDPSKLDGEGLAALKKKIGDAITTILADGKITDEERPYLTALQNFFGIIEGMMEDATETATKNAETAEETRQAGLDKRAQKARTKIELNDLTGGEAFLAGLEGYSTQLRQFFGAFDVSSLEGISAAKSYLNQFYTALEGLTDEQVLEKFGMTRDEVIAALTDVDGGLDNLATGLKELAKSQGDFLNDLNVQFLNATGRGLDAVKLQTKLWVEQMIATARALGVLTPEVERQIRTVGQSKIDAATQKSTEDFKALPIEQRVTLTDAVAAATEQAVSTIDGELATQSVQSITAPQAIAMTDILSASLIEQRGARQATERIALLMEAMAAQAIPALQVPSLPDGTAFGARAGGGVPTIQLTINLTGPILGQSASDAAQQFAKEVLPYINEALARAAGVEARLSGVPLA